MVQARLILFTCLAALGLILTGCESPPADTTGNLNSSVNANSGESRANSISTMGDPNEEISSEEIDRGRNDDDWKQYVQIEADDGSGQTPNNESLKDIDAKSINSEKILLPLGGGEGPSVLRVQILLDRSPFSPGIVDGLWGKNTEKAVYWLQKRYGLKATGKVDQDTFKKLLDLARSPDKFVVEHKLTEKDVSGPFVEIPSDIYEKAKLDCMCYETLEEKLSEMFHTSPEMLARLNPKAKLNELKSGDTISVPNVPDTQMNKNGEGANDTAVTKIVISDGGRYTHAVDQNGDIMYHFPTTLGSGYAPSPTGEWKINAIAWDPTWHYQPSLLTGEPDNKPDAIIPPGPNNPVGKVWMDLSKEHYGIHGTKAPETIGYATSHGCVRLTNWDAVFLANRVKEGTTVTFVDTRKGNSETGSKSGS